MEEVNLQDQIAQQGPPQAGSYNSSPKAKSGNSKWVIIFVILLILGGAGIFFFTKNSDEPIPTPTPGIKIIPIEITTPSPTKSPEPIKRDTITIEIQNGTGITGEAKLLQDKLKVLGYSEITVGNAVSTDNTDTTVTFLKTLSQTAQDEIKKELEKTYKSVIVKTSTTQKVDILILTGTRSASVSVSATPKASITPKPSATPIN